LASILVVFKKCSFSVVIHNWTVKTFNSRFSLCFDGKVGPQAEGEIFEGEGTSRLPNPEQPLNLTASVVTMKEPSIGKENLGAVIGAVIGALGGLVAITIPYAIMTGDFQALSAARKFGLISFVICVPGGWFSGGYLTHLLEKKFPVKFSAIVGGLLGGLIPVSVFAAWGYYLITR
jgi:hypothetical protein